MAAVTSCQNDLLESARRHAHTLDFVFSLLAKKLSCFNFIKLKALNITKELPVVQFGLWSYSEKKETVDLVIYKWRNMAPLRNYLDFYSFKSPFLGFRVIQLGYWPDFNLESVFIFKNIFNMKSVIDFRKMVETGVDPHLQYRIKAPSFNVSKERIHLFLSATGRGECNSPCHAKKYY